MGMKTGTRRNLVTEAIVSLIALSKRPLARFSANSRQLGSDQPYLGCLNIGR